jgi:hypothetical protein
MLGADFESVAKKVPIKSYTQKTFEYRTSTQVINQKPHFFYDILLVTFSHDFLTLFQRIQKALNFTFFIMNILNFVKKSCFDSLEANAD